VRDRLLTDHRLSAQPIDACCCDGCVSLVGFVETVEQKQLAVELVSGLIGVQSVRDEIVVRIVEPVAPEAVEDTWARV
jgi:osmotically-inducible protein OsmY